MPLVLEDMDDESFDSSDDSSYDHEGESDIEIESNASSIIPDSNHVDSQIYLSFDS